MAYRRNDGYEHPNRLINLMCFFSLNLDSLVTKLLFCILLDGMYSLTSSSCAVCKAKLLSALNLICCLLHQPWSWHCFWSRLLQLIWITFLCGFDG